MYELNRRELRVTGRSSVLHPHLTAKVQLRSSTFPLSQQPTRRDSFLDSPQPHFLKRETFYEFYKKNFQFGSERKGWRDVRRPLSLVSLIYGDSLESIEGRGVPVVACALLPVTTFPGKGERESDTSSMSRIDSHFNPHPHPTHLLLTGSGNYEKKEGNNGLRGFSSTGISSQSDWLKFRTNRSIQPTLHVKDIIFHG